MKILIYRDNYLLTSGGVERVLFSLSNELVARGHRVYLVTNDSLDSEPFYKLDPRVNFKQLKVSFSIIRRFLTKASGLRHIFPNVQEHIVGRKYKARYIHSVKPDIIMVSELDDLIAITYKNYFSKIPIVAMMHGSPTISYFTGRHKKKYAPFADRISVIQVLLEPFLAEIPNYFTAKKIAIGNPVSPNKTIIPREKIIVYMGRVCADKRQDFMINAFAKLAHKYPDWKVHLWGGTDWSKKYTKYCTDLIKKDNLGDQIFLKGLTNDVDREVARSSICAFPSKFEGFGMAMAESMVAGLACIGFKDCTGINQLVSDGVDGFLADDFDDFVNKLDMLLADADLRERFGQQAKNILDRFSIDKIVSMWESLFEQEIKEWAKNLSSL